jgi:hypothetical protein
LHEQHRLCNVILTSFRKLELVFVVDTACAVPIHRPGKVVAEERFGVESEFLECCQSIDR